MLFPGDRGDILTGQRRSPIENRRKTVLKRSNKAVESFQHQNVIAQLSESTPRPTAAVFSDFGAEPIFTKLAEPTV
jgi:hypothetical protein